MPFNQGDFDYGSGGGFGPYEARMEYAKDEINVLGKLIQGEL